MTSDLLLSWRRITFAKLTSSSICPSPATASWLSMVRCTKCSFETVACSMFAGARQVSPPWLPNHNVPSSPLMAPFQ